MKLNQILWALQGQSHFNTACYTKMRMNTYWILDSGATDHMSFDKSLFSTLHSLNNCITVHLPDSTFVKVSYAGQIALSKSLKLDQVLYIPKFHYNLLSISKLVRTSSMSLIFCSTCCIIQDPLIKRVVAMGREEGGLYKLNHMSFSPVEINTCLFEVMTIMPTLTSFVNTMLSQTCINKKALILLMVHAWMLIAFKIFMKD